MAEDIQLILATTDDAKDIHKMKYEAFLPLYERYHDDETSPVKEPLDKVIWQIQQEKNDYYFIKFQGALVGAVRVVEREKSVFYISSIFILPEYQNQGIGGKVITQLFALYPNAVTWKLSTILQEKRNCHLYEKYGFLKTGKKTKINENMTIIDYEKTNVMIRKYKDSDAEEIANLIIRNFKEVNIKDYGKEAVDELVRTHDAAWVREITSYAHMYVFCHDKTIVACGSISSYWGSEEESILLTVFVLPECHGKGIGRTIIKTLEEDELFKRAKRIEIPASITAVEFYRKFGYDFKNGEQKLDEEGHFRLEKFRDSVEYKSSVNINEM